MNHPLLDQRVQRIVGAARLLVLVDDVDLIARSGKPASWERVRGALAALAGLPNTFVGLWTVKSKEVIYGLAGEPGRYTLITSLGTACELHEGGRVVGQHVGCGKPQAMSTLRRRSQATSLVYIGVTHVDPCLLNHLGRDDLAVTVGADTGFPHMRLAGTGALADMLSGLVAQRGLFMSGRSLAAAGA